MASFCPACARNSDGSGLVTFTRSCSAAAQELVEAGPDGVAAVAERLVRSSSGAHTDRRNAGVEDSCSHDAVMNSMSSGAAHPLHRLPPLGVRGTGGGSVCSTGDLPILLSFVIIYSCSLIICSCCCLPSHVWVLSSPNLWQDRVAACDCEWWLCAAKATACFGLPAPASHWATLPPGLRLRCGTMLGPSSTAAPQSTQGDASKSQILKCASPLFNATVL